MNKAVVISGASSGIGYAAARELAAHGFHVFGGVRKPADAARLRESLGEGVTPLLFDVTDEAGIRHAAGEVAARIGTGVCLAGLVNNAGVAVIGPLMHLPIADFQRQLEVNLTGALRVTQAFLPLLGARRDAPHPRGRIVNISSVSGRFAMPFLGAYAASKFGLEALSDCLRRELSIYGIDVIVLEPGRIRTPIWSKLEDVARFAETDYAEPLKRITEGLQTRLSTALPVETVSRAILRALTARRPATRTPLPDQRLAGWILPRLLPERWLDWLISRKVFGEKRP